jgi:hypothetical protein
LGNECVQSFLLVKIFIVGIKRNNVVLLGDLLGETVVQSFLLVKIMPKQLSYILKN